MNCFSVWRWWMDSTASSCSLWTFWNSQTTHSTVCFWTQHFFLFFYVLFFVDCFCFSLFSGANLEAKTKQGQTALFFAAENCKGQCVRYSPTLSSISINHLIYLLIGWLIDWFLFELIFHFILLGRCYNWVRIQIKRITLDKLHSSTLHEWRH